MADTLAPRLQNRAGPRAGTWPYAGGIAARLVAGAPVVISSPACSSTHSRRHLLEFLGAFIGKTGTWVGYPHSG